ncbi:MAG: hypothetical protein JWM58_447 [Rhizobium sp.]|nr:hypothetical protein [Rhizobium sp.]
MADRKTSPDVQAYLDAVAEPTREMLERIRISSGQRHLTPKKSLPTAFRPSN